MRISGFKAPFGSWNTMPIVWPRTARICGSGNSLKFSPSSRTIPEDEAAGGNNLMILSAVIDLPDPDAPTTPRISPASTFRDRLLTIRVRSTLTFKPTASSATPLMQRLARGGADLHREGSTPARTAAPQLPETAPGRV